MKIRCAANSKSKYIWNLQNYKGVRERIPEVNQGENVVLDLTKNLSNHGHLTVIDDLFTFPKLFDILLNKGKTVRWWCEVMANFLIQLAPNGHFN